MWLIEFVSGHLTGVTLPLSPSLSVTGARESDDTHVLSVPEYLPKDKTLTFELDGQRLFVNGFFKNEKRKNLVANRVYRFKGLSFFLYEDGERNPKLRWYRVKQFLPLIMFSFILHMALAAGGFMLFQSQQASFIERYFKQIGSGYIKGDTLYIYDKMVLNDLPNYFKKNIKVIEDVPYLRTSQLDVEIISSTTGKSLKGVVLHKKDRDQIRVDTYEIDNQLMTLFGQNGISFVKKGDGWLVSDPEKASKLLKMNGLSTEVQNLKLKVDGEERIDVDQFPYSIFYSTQSVRYIYDTNNRYWEGSLVPNLGSIQEITRNKVVFKDGFKTRTYEIRNY